MTRSHMLGILVLVGIGSVALGIYLLAGLPWVLIAVGLLICGVALIWDAD